MTWKMVKLLNSNLTTSRKPFGVCCGLGKALERAHTASRWHHQTASCRMRASHQEKREAPGERYMRSWGPTTCHLSPSLWSARVEEWGAASVRASFYVNVHLKLSLVGFSGSWGRKAQPCLLQH